MARELVKANPDKYFMPDQFSNQYNKMAHYKTTGDEIWKQTGGKVDYFVSALGTSGTIMGVGKALKEHNPKIKVVSAHPVKGHYIQGLKNMEEAIVPAIYDPAEIDITIMVETEAAYEMTRQIVKQEGIFVGMSSGAAYVRCRGDGQANRDRGHRDHFPGPGREVPEHQPVLSVARILKTPSHLCNYISYFK